MAIAFARERRLSRRNGDNSVRTAAYNGRSNLRADRTDEWFHFGHRDDPAHHEILLPSDAPANWAESRVLWNETEKKENRVDSQVAREIVLALPKEIMELPISEEEQIAHQRALVESFARRAFRLAGPRCPDRYSRAAPKRDRGTTRKTGTPIF